MKIVYFSLFQSYLTYGLSVWGQTEHVNLIKLCTTQNRILRLMTDSDTPSNVMYGKVECLKLINLFDLKLSSLMWDFEKGSLPTSPNTLFHYRSDAHGYSTTSSHTGKLTTSTKYRTIRYGRNTFSSLGAKIFNELKENALYLEAKKKSTFTDNYKKYIISGYNDQI